jgi:uncharacterized damage-inducible protein DinB
MSDTAFAALSDVLRELATVVSQLTADEYVAVVSSCPSGSVGAHLRHCLDHVVALERGLTSGVVDYDNRRRRTPLERDRAAALAAIAAIRSRLGRLDPALVHRHVRVSVQVARAAAPLEVDSTVGRELAFVTSHTIHHSATIGVLLHARGRRVPRTFGIAASTPLAAERPPCALSA